MALKNLSRYELVEEVGRGGMAVVYRGLDTSLKREVAVKILHAHLAEQEESRERFQREAQAVAKLRHENIIEIYDYSGLDSDESYIVTEFIHGNTLKEFLARNPIPHPEIAALIVIQICDALQNAHSFGVIHRDVKPENIMVSRDGLIKLTDFGIAQVVDVRRLTITGQLLGSPAYMAPELVEGKRIDFRVDIFSVGTLLYQLATSELPFKGKNPHEVLKRIADGQFIDPEVANPIVGRHLGRIIKKALAHAPEERYQSIKALRDDLLEYIKVVNLADPKKEISAYFASPKEYSSKLQNQIVKTLLEKGKIALERKQTPIALDYFNRVLCSDPTNAEVLLHLDRIAQRRRFTRWLMTLGGAVLVGSVIYFLVIFWPSPTPDTKKLDNKTITSNVKDFGITSSQTTDAPPVIARHAVDARRSILPDGKDPHSVQSDHLDGSTPDHHHSHMPKIRRRVQIVPTPKAMTIWLNGKKLGAYGPDLRFIELPSGPVKLAFRNDACCFEHIVTVGPKQRLHLLRVKLPWKPARVKVIISPMVPADVLVGSLVTKPGNAVEVPIPSYSENGKSEVQIKVSAEQFYTETRKIEVRANSLITVNVPLRRQR